MKKIIIILLLLAGFQQTSLAQEKFLDILDSLSVSNSLIDTHVEGTTNNYFELMKDKKNFYFLDKSVLYVSSYKNFSAFYIHKIPSNTSKPQWNGDKRLLDDTRSSISAVRPKHILLFDHIRNKCYYINYDRKSADPCHIHSKVALITLYSGFHRDITSIKELNESLIPVSGISIILNLKSFEKPPTEPIKAGDISNYKCIYYHRKEEIAGKYTRFDNKGLNIKDITYDDLMKLLTVTKDDLERKDTDIFSNESLKDFYNPQFF